MSNFVSFTVPGEPRGKARARTVRDRRTGRSVTYTPEQTAIYETLVKVYFRKAAAKDGFRMIPKGMPVSVHIWAYFQPAKSTSRKKWDLIRSGQLLPLKKPDWDNIGKIICDALNGLAYHDDSQICWAVVHKNYICEEDEAPHVDVEISEG